MSEGATINPAAPSAAQLSTLRAGDKTTSVSLLLLVARTTTASTAACALGLTTGESGGKVTWRAPADFLLIGEDSQSWNELLVVDFPSRAALETQLASRVWHTAAETLQSHGACVLALVGRPMAGLANWCLRRAHHLKPLLRYRRQQRPVQTMELSPVTPTEQQIHLLETAPWQRERVAMLNLLKFRKRAHYSAGHSTGRSASSGPTSGRRAYQRYARVALRLVLARGGRVAWLGRFEQVLIGGDGTPSTHLWDEIALIEYPSLEHFRYMLNLVEYQDSHAHRDAGLERTQLLTTRPHKSGASASR